MPLEIHQQGIFNGHKAAVYSLVGSALNPDIFWSADGNGNIVQWDFAQGNMGKLIARLPEQIFSLSLYEQEQFLLAGGMNGGMYKIDLLQKQLAHDIITLPGTIYHSTEIGNKIGLCCKNGTFYVFDKNTLQKEFQIKVSDKALRRSVWLASENMLAFACSDSQIYLLNWHNNSLVQKLAQGHNDSVFDVCFLPHEQVILSGGKDAYLSIWKKNMDHSYELSHRIPAHHFTINRIVSLAPLPYFATASRDKSIKLWQNETYQLEKVLNSEKNASMHRYSVNTLWWIPSKRILLSAGDDGNIIAWNVLFH
ncbi:MAG: hypothetical protein R2798_05000 [Chitinophagales bacterium]|nr:hypothetical protein [Bacteroidota bacterium]MCB9042729.1 hypothetical protein [Chitinophagales bacterium]